jgi:hypothetical protein
MSSKVVLFVILALSISLAGCVRLTGPDGSVLSLGKDNFGYFLGSADLAPKGEQTLLKVTVKGSIYETGEQMSVFGTCFDGEGNGVNGSYAMFSAWYPNGTQFVNLSSMAELQTGYFLYQANMSAVQGTYLTEMDCMANISGNMYRAAAWGEWQNPYWVSRLANISDQIQNVSIQIGNLTILMNDSFNYTWSLLDGINASINESYYNLNQSIYYVAMVANASVDRNDSLLALLLYNLTSIIVTPSGGILNYTAFDVGDVVYKDNWHIKVRAYDPVTNAQVSSPDGECYITTTYTPIALMVPQGEHFAYSERINYMGDFNWNITCQYT